MTSARCTVRWLVVFDRHVGTTAEGWAVDREDVTLGVAVLDPACNSICAGGAAPVVRHSISLMARAGTRRPAREKHGIGNFAIRGFLVPLNRNGNKRGAAALMTQIPA